MHTTFTLHTVRSVALLLTISAVLVLDLDWKEGLG